MKIRISLLLLSFSAVLLSQNKTEPKKTKKDSIQKLDEILISTSTIFGSKYVAKNRTGSAYYISPNELKKYNPESTAYT